MYRWIISLGKIAAMISATLTTTPSTDIARCDPLLQGRGWRFVNFENIIGRQPTGVSRPTVLTMQYGCSVLDDIVSQLVCYHLKRDFITTSVQRPPSLLHH